MTADLRVQACQEPLQQKQRATLYGATGSVKEDTTTLIEKAATTAAAAVGRLPPQHILTAELKTDSPAAHHNLKRR